VSLMAADQCVGAPVPPPTGSSPGEGEGRSRRGDGVHCRAELAESNPWEGSARPRGQPGGLRWPRVRGQWFGKQAAPKTTSPAQCRQAASEAARTDLPVPVPASGQDLSSPRDQGSTAAGRTRELWFSPQWLGGKGLWGAFYSQQRLPPHLSLATGKKRGVAHGGRQTPPARPG